MQFEWDRGKAKKNNRKHKKTKTKKAQEELRPEYNFDYSKAVRGKYYKSFRVIKHGHFAAL